MDTITISPKYQVVIPRAVRDTLGLRPGEKMRVILYDGRVEYVPVRKMRATRGFLRGMDTELSRDGDRI